MTPLITAITIFLVLSALALGATIEQYLERRSIRRWFAKRDAEWRERRDHE